MYDTLDMQILDILFEDARISPAQIAVMAGAPLETVQQRIARLEGEGVLIRYPAVINWEKTEREMVQAVIEVRVQPQQDQGFDAVAARITAFEEVKSCYLMSGDYDLMVVMEAPTLKQLAAFVHAKLSPIESVTGTATHFILKTYKYGGALFEGSKKDGRLAVMP